VLASAAVFAPPFVPTTAVYTPLLSLHAESESDRAFRLIRIVRQQAVALEDKLHALFQLQLLLAALSVAELTDLCRNALIPLQRVKLGSGMGLELLLEGSVYGA
jgi:hypothetical protein